MITRRVPSLIQRALVRAAPLVQKSKFVPTESIGFVEDLGSAVGIRTEAVITRFPAAPVNMAIALDLLWFVDGQPRVVANTFGEFLKSIPGATSPLGVTSVSRFVRATGLTGLSRLALRSIGDFVVEGNKNNWVKWSNIGSVDFTIGLDNVAGERPLDWKGNVFCLKKFRDGIVAYGENGVSMLSPVDTAFGLVPVYTIGLKSKHAITGDNSKHFFIDRLGQLWRLADSLEILDYSEFFAGMANNLVMSYDAGYNLVYICDATRGYVYNPVLNSLGECSPSITGFGYQGNVQYITASAALVTSPFEIVTDIYDFGTTKGKTIYAIEVGANLQNPLYISIQYSRDKKGVFISTPEQVVVPRGKTCIIAHGKEFRFRLRTLVYEYFVLEYIAIEGRIHTS